MCPEEREATIRETTERLAERLRQHSPDEQVRRREDNQSACLCGVALFRGYYGLTVTSEHGPVRLERAYYYYCASCRQGHCSTDRSLGLGPAAAPPAAQAKVAALGARLR